MPTVKPYEVMLYDDDCFVRDGWYYHKVFEESPYCQASDGRVIYTVSGEYGDPVTVDTSWVLYHE